LETLKLRFISKDNYQLITQILPECFSRLGPGQESEVVRVITVIKIIDLEEGQFTSRPDSIQLIFRKKSHLLYQHHIRMMMDNWIKDLKII